MPNKDGARTSDPSTPITLIGYWEGEYEPGWPKVADFVDEHWDQDEREFVAFYLEHGLDPASFLATRLVEMSLLRGGERLA